MPTHETELAGLLVAAEREELIAWAEARLAPWPPAAEAPQLARCAVEGPALDMLVARISGRLGRALKLCGAAYIARFDAGQRLLPAPGGEPPESLAVVVALSGGHAGGELVTYPPGGPRYHALAAGAALAFPAYLASEELPVREGRKYVLRMALAEAP